MFRRFNAKKAIQSIGVLLVHEQERIAGKLRILKLLYIADRESIQERGLPILGSRMVAMDHGPLHSEVLDLINGEHIEEPVFSRFFDLVGYRVRMRQDPGVASLSKWEIEKLREVSHRYANAGDFELAHDVCHQFEEWKRHHATGTSRTIPLEDIVSAVGRGPDQEAILADLRLESRFDELFDTPSK